MALTLYNNGRKTKLSQCFQKVAPPTTLPQKDFFSVTGFLFACLFVTGLPVAQPSYKLGSVFPSGTNRTLACSARAQDISVCVECVE